MTKPDPRRPTHHSARSETEPKDPRRRTLCTIEGDPSTRYRSLRMTAYSDTTRSKVSEDFNDTQKLAYNGVNTAVDENISNAAFKGMSMLSDSDKVGEAGKRIFDTVGTYGDTTYNTAVNGATTNESIAASTANAGLNWLTSKIDVANLLEIKSSEDWAKVANIMIGETANVSQEELEYIGNLVIETALLAENSNFNQQVNALVQTGVPEDVAKKTVYEQYIGELELATTLKYAADLLLDLD